MHKFFERLLGRTYSILSSGMTIQSLRSIGFNRIRTCSLLELCNFITSYNNFYQIVMIYPLGPSDSEISVYKQVLIRHLKLKVKIFHWSYRTIKNNQTTLFFSAKKPQSKSLCMVRIIFAKFKSYWKI